MESEHSVKKYATSSHFDELPEEVLRHLLRQTSDRPQSPDWTAFLDPKTLLSLCEGGGELGDLARRSVSSIAIPSVHGRIENGATGYVDEHDMSDAYTYEAKENETPLYVDVTTASGRRDFKGLVKQLGQQLRMLILSFSYFWAEGKQFSAHCSNLETLVLYDKYTEFDLPAVLKACSGKLRTLDLGAEFLPPRYIDGIATHCKGLVKLGLKFGEIGGPLRPLWESVGPTLRELCFGEPEPVSECDFPDNTFYVQEELLKFCAVLETLEIRDIGFGTMPVNTVLEFGKQLNRLVMTTCRSCFGPGELRMIFEACREDIVVEARVDSEIVHTLGVLAYHVEVLKVNYDEVEEGLAAVGRGCTMLHDLEIRVSTDYAGYFLTNFLQEPKPHLRKLNIAVDGYSKMDRDHNIFNQLAETVDTIECLVSFVYCISEGVFEKFARKNEKIKSVRITCGRGSWSVDESIFDDTYIGDRNSPINRTKAEEAAVSFLTDFSICVELQELVLCDELLEKKSRRILQTVEETNRLPKSLYVFIGGIHYNQ